MIRASRRRASYVSVDEKVLDDFDTLNAITKKLKSNIQSEKGRRFLNYNLKIGHVNDDFIHNNVTLLLTADAFKKPRFIK